MFCIFLNISRIILFPFAHFVTGVNYSRLHFYRESYHYEFSEDLEMGILYLSSKFERDRFTNNGDPFESIGQKSLDRQTHRLNLIHLII